MFSTSVGSSTVFLNSATSSANIALGLAGVFSYDDRVFPCDRCEYEVVPKENEEDHKILKQVSRDAPPVVKQESVKCDYCHKALFGGNSLM